MLRAPLDALHRRRIAFPGARLTGNPPSKMSLRDYRKHWTSGMRPPEIPTEDDDAAPTLARQGVPKCYMCGEMGHISDNCPWGQRVCHKCKQPGHEYAACPTRGLRVCYHCKQPGHEYAACPARGTAQAKDRASGGEVGGESVNEQEEALANHEAALAELGKMLGMKDEPAKIPPEDDDAALTLARPPPSLVFGQRAAKRFEAARASPPPAPHATPPPKSSRFAETHGPHPWLKYIPGATPAPSPPALPMASVVLMPLPPFTTLADVSRIALRAGAAPGDVMGVKLWLSSKRERGDSASAQHTAATDEEDKDKLSSKDKPTGENEDFRRVPPRGTCGGVGADKAREDGAGHPGGGVGFEGEGGGG
ncbi:hypothetical protein B0H14DRAFT_1020750 [Mycena olivaceomarginata]|nr:hypothetical protein B0H14DRAFT_1020750 [Mycena olivaceomarginata]